MNYETRRDAALKAAEKKRIADQTACQREGWVTVREACAIMRCGKTKFYAHLRERPEGFPRLIRFCGTNLFKREEVDAWMESRALW